MPLSPPDYGFLQSILGDPKMMCLDFHFRNCVFMCEKIERQHVTMEGAHEKCGEREYVYPSVEWNENTPLNWAKEKRGIITHVDEGNSRCVVRWFEAITGKPISWASEIEEQRKLKKMKEGEPDDDHLKEGDGAAAAETAHRDSSSSKATPKPEWYPKKYYSCGPDVFELRGRGDGWLNPDGDDPQGVKYRKRVRRGNEVARLRSVIIGPIARFDMFIQLSNQVFSPWPAEVRVPRPWKLETSLVDRSEIIDFGPYSDAGTVDDLKCAEFREQAIEMFSQRRNPRYGRLRTWQREILRAAYLVGKSAWEALVVGTGGTVSPGGTNQQASRRVGRSPTSRGAADVAGGSLRSGSAPARPVSPSGRTYNQQESCNADGKSRANVGASAHHPFSGANVSTRGEHPGVAVAIRIDGVDGLPTVQLTASQLKFLAIHGMTWGNWGGWKGGIELKRFPRHPTETEKALYRTWWLKKMEFLAARIKRREDAALAKKELPKDDWTDSEAEDEDEVRT